MKELYSLFTIYLRDVIIRQIINENVDIINKMVYNNAIQRAGRRFMRIDEQLKILAVKSNMTLAEMARRLDKSPQAFSQKMKRGNFTIDDLYDIALATDSRLECAFILSNGDRIILEEL